jgi:V/A-type H+-transporting ATPase subunit C
VKKLAGNTAYVASRAKSRRKKLADLSRMRQLINQSTDQLTTSVSNMGYSDEVNLYAGKLTGADLVEAALTHNLESELNNILSMCNGKIRDVVEIYSSRFEYQNAKVVLRSVVNKVSLDKVSNSILPDLNEINTPWLKIIENSDDLRSAVLQMRRKSFGSDLKSLSEDSRLSDYEDALDRHYYKSAIMSLKTNNPPTRYLRDYLAMEIDHRNMLNVLEADSIGITPEETASMLIPGGKILPTRSFTTIAAGGRSALMDVLRASSKFDMAHFETLLEEVSKSRSLDSVVTWFKEREYKFMKKMSYLHPISALPIVYYVAMKVQEVADLRIIVRGRFAGLPPEVLEAHIL